MGSDIKQHSRALTDKQLEVLKLLFRFRFGTAELIAQAQGGVTVQSIRNRLNSLLKNDYIIVKREGKDRLMGRPGTFRLSAKGRAYLKEQGKGKYSEKVLNAIRANRDVSERFIDRQLTIFRISNSLESNYGEDLLFLTKSNLAADKFAYMPEVKPDALIHLSDIKKSYFLFFLDETIPDFALVRRVAPIFEYEKSGKWEAATGQKLPAVLLMCASNRIETLMRKRISKLAVDNQSEAIFAATTLAKFLEGEIAKPWRVLTDDTPFELKEL